MRKSPPVPSHRGWLLFCPIYLTDLNSEAPTIWERYEILFPLLFLAIWLQQSANCLLSLIDSNYEPTWMFWCVTEMDSDD